MSEVTNLIFCFSNLEHKEERIREVNSFVYHGLEMDLVSVDHNKDMEKGFSWYGGTKFLEAPIYIGAFNYFPLSEFLDHVKKIRWLEPGSVQLIVKKQDDDKFRIVEIV